MGMAYEVYALNPPPKFRPAKRAHFRRPLFSHGARPMNPFSGVQRPSFSAYRPMGHIGLGRPLGGLGAPLGGLGFAKPRSPFALPYDSNPARKSSKKSSKKSGKKNSGKKSASKKRSSRKRSKNAPKSRPKPAAKKANSMAKTKSRARKRPCAGAIKRALLARGCAIKPRSKRRSAKQIAAAKRLGALSKARAAARRAMTSAPSAVLAGGDRSDASGWSSNPRRKRRSMRHHNPKKHKKLSKAARAAISKRNLKKARAARKALKGKFVRVGLPKRSKPAGVKRWSKASRIPAFLPSFVSSLAAADRKRILGRAHAAGYQNNPGKRRKRHRNPGVVEAVKLSAERVASMPNVMAALVGTASFGLANLLPALTAQKSGKGVFDTGIGGVIASASATALAAAAALKFSPQHAGAAVLGGSIATVVRLAALLLGADKTAKLGLPKAGMADYVQILPAPASPGMNDYVMLQGGAPGMSFYDGSVATGMGFPVLTGEDIIRGEAATGMHDYVGVGGAATQFGAESF